MYLFYIECVHLDTWKCLKLLVRSSKLSSTWFGFTRMGAVVLDEGIFLSALKLPSLLKYEYKKVINLVEELCITCYATNFFLCFGKVFILKNDRYNYVFDK